MGSLREPERLRSGGGLPRFAGIAHRVTLSTRTQKRGGGLRDFAWAPQARLPKAGPLNRRDLSQSAARSEIQRILDRAARPLLDARLERQSIEAATGRDGDAREHGLDESAALVQVQEVPVLIGVDDEGDVEGG